MQITEFKNQSFYYSILALLTCLILYNCYVILTFQETWGFIPILIQAAIIGMIISKHKFAKIILKIWAIVFLLIGSALQIILQGIEDVMNESEIDLVFYTVAAINLIVGSVVIYFTNQTVIVRNADSQL